MANPVLLFQDIDSGETGPGALDVRGSRSAAGIITFDNKDDTNPTFVLDVVNRRVGHARSGTAFVPLFDYHYQIEGANGTYSFDLYSNVGGENFEIVGRRARGTIALPTALADDDDMWEFSCVGHDGTAFSGQAAAMLFEAAGAWTGTSHGTRTIFKTTENGTIVLVEVLVLGDDGCVVIAGQTNGLIGAVAGEYLRVVGATRGQGTIGVFANSTDTQPQSQLVDGSIIMGVGGVTAPDCRLRRTAVATFTLDNNGVGAVTVVPAADSQNVLGTSALRWSDIVANTHRVFATASDANPTAQLSTGAIILGAGGATALDTRMRWSAAATITFDNNGAGGISLVPATTNTGQIGTDALKWNRVRALSVVTGDLEMQDEERNAHWVFREETERIVVTNKVTGKKYILAMKELEEHAA